MAKINIMPGTGNFEKVLTILQGATGCICYPEGNEMEIYSFDGFHELIMSTLKSETNARILRCTTDPEEIAA